MEEPMDRRSFAKALASVAGAMKLKSEKSPRPVPNLPVPSNREEGGLWGEDFPEAQGHSPFSPVNPWARRPSDPPITLKQQLMLKEPGGAKSYNNSDRFFSSSSHPVAKAKNLYAARVVHNHYPKYHNQKYFRDYGNPVENWIKQRRNRRISTELKDLKEELKGLQGD